jgi:hypothetical protein
VGGRPQQILAVALTYFAITTSYIPVFVYQQVKNPTTLKQTHAKPGNQADQQTAAAAIVTLLLIFAAAPFLGLANGVGALVSLFTIFIGLRQAWTLTGRREVLIMGNPMMKPPHELPKLRKPARRRCAKLHELP